MPLPCAPRTPSARTRRPQLRNSPPPRRGGRARAAPGRARGATGRPRPGSPRAPRAARAPCARSRRPRRSRRAGGARSRGSPSACAASGCDSASTASANDALQVVDRLLGLPEQEVQPAEVEHQPTDVALVVELLVERLRLLRVVARDDPVAHPLGDERRLEVGVRDDAAVVHALGELERGLDVLARCLEVALAAPAARAPAEDVGPEEVAREAGGVGERERLVEERRPRLRRSRACSGRRRAGRGCPPGRRRRTAALRRARGRPGADRPTRGRHRPARAPRPRRRARAPRARPSRSRRCRAGPRRTARPPRRTGATRSAPRRVRAAPRSGREGRSRPRCRGTRRRRRAAPASQAIASSVGRVLPRSIWLMYSFENRSPATWVCVSPGGEAQRAQPLAEARGRRGRGRRDRRSAGASSSVVVRRAGGGVHLSVSQGDSPLSCLPPKG